jgi:hydroxymethylbilane synthase
MSLPISLRIAGRRAVIVGGGVVALRKCRALLEAGAAVHVVAPHLNRELRALLGEPGSYDERGYQSGDLAGAFLVVAATDDSAVNALVVADARAARVLVIDAASSQAGDAIMLATARIGEMTVAVDSGGSTPAFARRVALEARERFGEGYARAARVLAYARIYVKALLPPPQRAPVLRVLSELPIEMLATMTPVDIEHEAESTIEKLQSKGKKAPHTNAVTCASRASALAMTQTRTVAAKLAQSGIATTILNVSTIGDRITDRPLHALGGENVFVTELEAALREGRADYAVHSCKDLPSTLADDMRIVAIPAREDARDAFCSERYATFADLPAGARVGTSSPRRRAQLAALRPDLQYDNLRGNVDTRLRKLHAGDYDAVVLAMAGLNRLKARAKHTVPFDLEELVPAASQGALAIETRSDANDLAHALHEALNDANTELCVAAERATLRALRAGCSAPIGVHARLRGETLDVVLAYAIAQSKQPRIVRATTSARVSTTAQAEALGTRTAELLRETLPLAGRTILLPRTQERPSAIAAALREAGADVIELRSQVIADGHPADLIVFPSSGSVAVADASLHDRPPHLAVAVMGPKTAAAAAAAGWHPDLVADEPSTPELVGLVRSYLERRPL